jgi:hypothetical protein
MQKKTVLSEEKLSLMEKLNKTWKKFTRPILESLGITAKEAKDAGFKVSLPRFVKGDHFYKQLPYKRRKGKWRVKQ